MSFSTADSIVNSPSNYELKTDFHPIPSEYSIVDTETETKIDLGNIEKSMDVGNSEPSTSMKADATMAEDKATAEEQLEVKLVDVGDSEPSTSMRANATMSEDKATAEEELDSEVKVVDVGDSEPSTCVGVDAALSTTVENKATTENQFEVKLEELESQIETFVTANNVKVNKEEENDSENITVIIKNDSASEEENTPLPVDVVQSAEPRVCSDSELIENKGAILEMSLERKTKDKVECIKSEEVADESVL